MFVYQSPCVYPLFIEDHHLIHSFPTFARLAQRFRSEFPRHVVAFPCREHQKPAPPYMSTTSAVGSTSAVPCRPQHPHVFSQPATPSRNGWGDPAMLSMPADCAHFAQTSPYAASTSSASGMMTIPMQFQQNGSTFYYAFPNAGQPQLINWTPTMGSHVAYPPPQHHHAGVPSTVTMPSALASLSGSFHGSLAMPYAGVSVMSQLLPPPAQRPPLLYLLYFNSRKRSPSLRQCEVNSPLGYSR
jgi:hypothetical protein